MAMNENTLKNAIISALESDPQFSNDISQDSPSLERLVTIISTQIISHIQSNAVVSTTVSTATTCPSGSGMGTGTGSGSIA